MVQAIGAIDRAMEEEFFAYLQYLQYNWVEAMENVLQVSLEEKQREFVELVQNNDKVELTSAHGVGKTFSAALITLTVMMLWPYALVVSTAPTNRQVETLLWQEIGRRFNSSILPSLGFPPPMTKTWKIAPGWFAVGASSDEGVNVEGFHSPTVIVYIIDEAKGVRDEIFESLKGGMNAPISKEIRITTPGATFGEHYECARGNKKHLWNHLTISAWDVPRLHKWAAEMKEEWGEESAIYKMRVLGQYCDEAEFRVFPRRLIDKFRETGTKITGTSPRILGVDVARFGGAKTVFSYRYGAKHERQESFVGLRTTEVADRVASRIKQYNIDTVVVDVVGVGGGVLDGFVQKGYGDKVVAFNSKSKVEGDNYAFYDNHKTEAAFLLQKAIEAGEIGGNLTPELEHDLSAYEYTILQRNEKKKLVDPEGDGNSPDFGDALLMAFSVDSSDSACIIHNDAYASAASQSERDVLAFPQSGRRPSVLEDTEDGRTNERFKSRYLTHF